VHNDFVDERLVVPGDETRRLSGALGRRVAQYLIDQRLSQRDLAKKLGCSQATMSLFLTNRRPTTSLTFYMQIARLLGCSLSELFAQLERRPISPPPPLRVTTTRWQVGPTDQQ